MPKYRDLEMTNAEIVHRYGMAGETDNEKKAQIRVIAELNACEPADIVAVLEEEGVELPEKVRKVRKGRSRGVGTDDLQDALQDALEAPEPGDGTTEPTMPAPMMVEQPTYTITLKLAALDTIEKMLPQGDFPGAEALNFTIKVRAIFDFVKEVTA